MNNLDTCILCHDCFDAKRRRAFEKSKKTKHRYFVSYFIFKDDLTFMPAECCTTFGEKISISEFENYIRNHVDLAGDAKSIVFNNFIYLGEVRVTEVIWTESKKLKGFYMSNNFDPEEPHLYHPVIMPICNLNAITNKNYRYLCPVCNLDDCEHRFWVQDIINNCEKISG